MARGGMACLEGAGLVFDDVFTGWAFAFMRGGSEAFRDPGVGMSGKTALIALYKAAVAETKLRGFAETLTGRVPMQGQPTAGGANGKANIAQVIFQLVPVICGGENRSEARTQGREELLVRPIGRPRIFPSGNLCRQKIAQQLTDRDILFPGDLVRNDQHVEIDFEMDIL
ncbi:hypothetical protein SAMN04488093_104217 [Tropicibacter naphthalenivorans]|uniref:Uncharacterized protein n=1 Tax=Tropicibacter naphthalenivorans TaxID=441103 RepID=A0A0P1GVQ9_9RHOB|nr:hypothetical protein TRN7648_02055 [Tropicibacter naphthalenivorans]SMC80995.1 hypothetical protein SAMN04488093_104217 [Tropicibacter naphthalenivorans]